MPEALRQSVAETFKAGRLKDMSLKVSRETVQLPQIDDVVKCSKQSEQQTPKHVGTDEWPVNTVREAGDQDPGLVGLPSVEVLSYNSELLMYMAHQFVKNDATLRKQRTKDQARIEVRSRLGSSDSDKFAPSDIFGRSAENIAGVDTEPSGHADSMCPSGGRVPAAVLP